MSINASVTLSIGELDSLRDEIKSLKKEVEEYKERERTVQIKVIDSLVRPQFEYSKDKYGSLRSNYINKTVIVESYKNIDDIMEPLSQKAMEGVHKQLSSLNGQISTGTSKIAELEKKLREKCDELVSVKAKQDHKTLEEKLAQAEVDKEDIKIKSAERLQEVVNGYNLLQKTIDQLKSRKWYHLLFNKSKV